MLRPDDLPAEVHALLERARNAGSTLWVVGGALRDARHGGPIEDIDLGSALRPSEFVALLDDPPSARRDDRLGVCSLRCGRHEVVHTTFRVESDYGSDRRPRQVGFVDDPRLDSVRRDFTANALYLEPLSGVLLDFHGGRADLEASRLRTIGDPRQRFREDPLRILRAVRFEARSGLRPTPACAAAMGEFAGALASLVPQRRFLELDAILRSFDARPAIDRLLDLGAWDAIVAGLDARSPAIRNRLEGFGPQTARDLPGRWRRLLGVGEQAESSLRKLEAPRELRRRLAAISADPD